MLSKAANFCPRISASLDNGKKKDKIKLKLQIAPYALKGVDMRALEKMVEDIGKQRGKKSDIKVRVEISKLQ